MSDPSAAPNEGELLASAADKLIYADLPQPAAGELVPVAAGVHWFRAPLAGDLSHINLWLIEDGAGCIGVDTGMAMDESRELWKQLQAGFLREKPLQRLLITHLHPDHVGLAAWLQEQLGVPVWMSERTNRQLQRLFAPLTAEEKHERTRFLISHGVSPEEAALMFGAKFRTVVSGAPRVEHFPTDGEEVFWGGRRWRFIEAGGHAFGHLCLHAPEARLLVSGDQVLPTISPNISLHEPRLDANPLSSYLDSLERLAQLDADTLVLPSHGRPFYGLRPRALDLRDHHHEHLATLCQAAAAGPLTAQSVLPVLFFRPLHGLNRFLALGEAVAHLEYLAAAGKLQRVVSAAGQVSFRAL